MLQDWQELSLLKDILELPHQKAQGGGVLTLHHVGVSWDLAALSVPHYLSRQSALDLCLQALWAETE